MAKNGPEHPNFSPKNGQNGPEHPNFSPKNGQNTDPNGPEHFTYM